MAEITPEAKKTDGITNDLVEIVQPSIEKMIYVIREMCIRDRLCSHRQGCVANVTRIESY